MIDELRDYVFKMKGKDYYDFEMFLKRDKDDEDLDEISKRRLVELYEKYYRKK
ncbi:MAG: hypothetical protein AABZ61_04525 [Bacteroidota bacterium]